MYAQDGWHYGTQQPDSEQRLYQDIMNHEENAQSCEELIDPEWHGAIANRVARLGGRLHVDVQPDVEWSKKPSRILGARPRWLQDDAVPRVWSYSNLVKLCGTLGHSKEDVCTALKASSLLEAACAFEYPHLRPRIHSMSQILGINPNSLTMLYEALVSGEQSLVYPDHGHHTTIKNRSQMDQLCSDLNMEAARVAWNGLEMYTNYAERMGIGGNAEMPKCPDDLRRRLEEWKGVKVGKDVFLRGDCHFKKFDIPKALAVIRERLVGRPDWDFRKTTRETLTVAIPSPQELRMCGYRLSCFPTLTSQRHQMIVESVLKDPETALCKYLVKYASFFNNVDNANHIDEMCFVFAEASPERQQELARFQPRELVRLMAEERRKQVVPFVEFTWTHAFIPQNACDGFFVDALRNSHALRDAGSDLHNCAARYIDKVAAGYSLVLVLRHREKTVSMAELSWTDNAPKVVQVVESCNRDPRELYLTKWGLCSDYIAGFFSQAPYPLGSLFISKALNLCPEADLMSLLARQADTSVRWPDCGGMLHVAAAGGYINLVQHLAQNHFKTNVDPEDRYGWTPLHYAASRGFSMMIHVLLRLGADVLRATTEGWTPFHLAITRHTTLDLEDLRKATVAAIWKGIFQTGNDELSLAAVRTAACSALDQVLRATDLTVEDRMKLVNVRQSVSEYLSNEKKWSLGDFDKVFNIFPDVIVAMIGNSWSKLVNQDTSTSTMVLV